MVHESGSGVAAATSGALRDIRVVDFTRGLAGAITSVLLADHEAEVIRVQSSDGHEAVPSVWHRNKLRVQLDIESYDGLRKARELLATADIALFDQPPGELERLGLSADVVQRDCPALIHVWLPPFGVYGRWSHLPPNDLLLSALSGLPSQQAVEGQPAHLVLPQLSLGHAFTAAAAIGATLAERERTGKGQALTVSGLNGIASLRTGSLAKPVVATPVARSPRGLPHYHLFRCQDGQWLFLGALRHVFFLRVLELMGLLDLLVIEGVDGEVTKLMQSPLGEIALDRMEELFATRPRAEWLQILSDPLIPITPVNDRETWFQGETVRANDMCVVVDDPNRGAYVMPGVATKLSVTPGSVRHLQRDTDLDLLLNRPAPHVAGTTTGDMPHRQRLPLDEVVILDLTTAIAGSFVGTVLANFGAHVIKIEPPDGDFYRMSTAVGFLGWNWGKRGVVIDLKTEEGLCLFHHMVSRADVVVDNFRPGVTRRLRIDDRHLRAINPRIITASVTGYGPRGALSTAPAFDTVLQAASGMMYTQGGPGKPVNLSSSPVDVCTAMSAAFGITTALYARERLGVGQSVGASLSDLAVFFQTQQLAAPASRVSAAHTELSGEGSILGVSALERFYQCCDGWIALAARPDQAALLEEALGCRVDLVGPGTRGSTVLAPHGPVAQEVERALGNLGREDVCDRLLTRGIAVTPVLDQAALYHDSFFTANHVFEESVHQEIGPLTVVRSFATWGGVDGAFARPAPMLGEHTREILREFSVDETKIQSLLNRGVIWQAEPAIGNNEAAASA